MCTAVSMSVSNELRGIGSVLGSSEYPRSKNAPSLRRTLSADMSSKKWLSKNGFCPLKRIASSEEFQTVTDAAGVDSPVWNPKKEDEPPGQTDIWSMIVSQKSSKELTPYVHPLAKRNRSLSQLSLQICTESLGSETGSDVFSSGAPSETSDEEPEEEREIEVEEEAAVVVHKKELVAVNYSSFAAKKPLPRSFPPPLPSLSQSGVSMRSRRIDGRLVMEAVPVQAPTQSYFQAQREGGRLLLTFATPKPDETIYSDTTLVQIQEEEEEEEDVFNEVEDEVDESEEEEYDSEEENQEPVSDRGIVLEMKACQSSPPRKVPTGVINVHRSAFKVNKLMSLTNIDPAWSSKLEKIADDDEDQMPLAQSLPMVTRLMPQSTAASSFNTYDYCWRTNKSVAVSSLPPTVCSHPLTQNRPPNNNFLLPEKLNRQAQQEMVLMRGNKADCLVPVFKGCKEPKRSLFIWEPHCIAT